MRMSWLNFSLPLPTATTAGFEMPGIHRNRQVGNETIHGLPAAVGDETVIIIPVCEFNGFQCFCNDSDLVQLDQHGIGNLFTDSFLNNVRAGTKDIITNQLYPVAKGSWSNSAILPSHSLPVHR